MKKFKILHQMLVTFWFGWCCIAGILAVLIISAFIPHQFTIEEIITTGSILGIFTGGFAALLLLLLSMYPIQKNTTTQERVLGGNCF